MENLLNEFQKLMEQVTSIKQKSDVNLIEDCKLDFLQFEFLLMIEFIKIAQAKA